MTIKDKKQRKIAKIMREFKEGTLKSSNGEIVTDKNQALAIAISEAEDKFGKSLMDDINISSIDEAIEILE
jgi:hypothetical protein